MNILITGVAGFIGSHLAEAFSADKANWVAGADNLETGRLMNWSRAVELDISNRKLFYAFANEVEPDLVIHCAASYKDPNLWHRDIDTNTAGTVNALLVAKHHTAKFVYFQTALPPISSYAISKIAGEHYIRLSGVQHLIFRLANIYGPRNVSGPIPAFFQRLERNEACTVVQTTREMVFIDDLVECVFDALARGLEGTFDVCSGHKTPIAQLYGEVASHFKSARIAEFVAPAQDDVQTELSVERRVPGWKPTTPLNFGIARAVDWYREHGVEKAYTHLSLKG